LTDKESLNQLLGDCSRLWKNKSWTELEQASMKAIRIVINSNKTEFTLKRLAKMYLSSLIGDTDKFQEYAKINNFDTPQNFKLFKSWVMRHKSISSALIEYLLAFDEIFLLSKNFNARNKNMIAKNLRTIARPDLAIELLNENLKISKINYYSRTLRGASFADLGLFDKSIEDCKIALEFDLEDGKQIPMNVLSRAFRGRFLSTGDLSDLEDSISHAEQSYRMKPSIFSANSLMASTVLTRNEKRIKEVEEILSRHKDFKKIPDKVAIDNALDIIENNIDTEFE
jgi:hypothetical protein